MRITKSREERRSEILVVAQELFVTNGFVKTTISDIVKKMNVAQGTFYNYFKSKDDILNTILEHCVESIAKNAERIANLEGVSALGKLERLIRFSLEFDGWSNEIIEYIHKEENVILHHMLETRTTKSVVPIVATIVRQGMEEKTFHITYPMETAEIIIVGLGGMFDTIKQLPPGSPKLTEKLMAIEELLERILGVAKGSIRIRKP